MNESRREYDVQTERPQIYRLASSAGSRFSVGKQDLGSSRVEVFNWAPQNVTGNTTNYQDLPDGSMGSDRSQFVRRGSRASSRTPSTQARRQVRFGSLSVSHSLDRSPRTSRSASSGDDSNRQSRSDSEVIGVSRTVSLKSEAPTTAGASPRTSIDLPNSRILNVQETVENAKAEESVTMSSGPEVETGAQLSPVMTAKASSIMSATSIEHISPTGKPSSENAQSGLSRDFDVEIPLHSQQKVQAFFSWATDSSSTDDLQSSLTASEGDAYDQILSDVHHRLQGNSLYKRCPDVTVRHVEQRHKFLAVRPTLLNQSGRHTHLIWHSQLCTKLANQLADAGNWDVADLVSISLVLFSDRQAD